MNFGFTLCDKFGAPSFPYILVFNNLVTLGLIKVTK